MASFDPISGLPVSAATAVPNVRWGGWRVAPGRQTPAALPRGRPRFFRVPGAGARPPSPIRRWLVARSPAPVAATAARFFRVPPPTAAQPSLVVTGRLARVWAMPPLPGHAAFRPVPAPPPLDAPAMPKIRRSRRGFFFPMPPVGEGVPPPPPRLLPVRSSRGWTPWPTGRTGWRPLPPATPPATTLPPVRVSAARSPHVPPPLGSAAYRRLPGEPPPPLLAPPGPRLRKSRKQFFWPLPGINVRPAPVAGGVIPARVARGVVPVPTGRAVWTRLPAPYPPTLPLPARVARGDQVGATLPAHSRRFAPAVLRLPPTNDVVPPIRLARGVVPVWAFPHAARFGLWFGTGLGTPATPLGLPEVCPDRPPALPPSDTFPPGMPTPDALPPGLADADAWPAAGDRADRFPPAAPDGDQFPAAVADPAAFPPAGVDADRFPARLAEADAQPQAAQQPAAQPATIEDSVQQTKRVEFTDGFPSKRNECG